MKKWLIGGLISAGISIIALAWMIFTIILPAIHAGANMSSGFFKWTGVLIYILIAFIIGAVLGWIIELLTEKFNLKKWVVGLIVLILIAVYILFFKMAFSPLKV